MSRITDYILAEPWAIREESLRLIVEIADRENPLDLEALNAAKARRLDGAHVAQVVGSTAVVPVTGPTFRYANLFTEMSGATSLEMLASDLKSAVDNPSVRSILLSIDSPGGEVNGTDEFSELVRAARTRKPVWAYISNEGASAAYWIASAAERIIIAPTALAGSIGVVASVPKPRDGRSRDLEFVSSQSPNKRVDLSTDEGKAKVQAIVDSIADVFVSKVARNRGITADQVIEGFGQGDVFVGQQAVGVGMADALGTFESVTNEMAGLGSASTVGGVPIMGVRDAWEAVRAHFDASFEAGGESLENAPPSVASVDAVAAGEAVHAAAPLENSSVSPNSSEGEIVENPNTNVAAATNTGSAGIAVPDTSSAIPAPVQSQASEELAALRAENRRLRVERYQAEAREFVGQQMSDGRAFPAVKEALIAMFVQASHDDAEFGATVDGKSRVELLKAFYANMPTHQLSIDNIAPELVKALQPVRTMDASDPEKIKAEVAALLSSSPLGAAIAKERNGSRN